MGDFNATGVKKKKKGVIMTHLRMNRYKLISSLKLIVLNKLYMNQLTYFLITHHVFNLLLQPTISSGCQWYSSLSSL